MPVVKAQQAHIVRQSAIVMDLSDLERQASTIVAEAQAQAERIIVDAKARATQEAESIRAQACEAGRAEGFAVGQAEGQQAGHQEAVGRVQQALVELTGRWTQTLDVIEQNLPTHVADAKADLVRLALAIAERITRQESLRNKRVVQETIANLLALVGAGRTVALHVNPNEVATLEAYLPELLNKLRSVSAVELVPDESITEGGCIARFGAGQIDATVETQIQRIAEELLADQEEGVPKVQS